MTKQINVYVCDKCGKESSDNGEHCIFNDIHPFENWLSLNMVSPFLKDKIDKKMSHEFCSKKCLISFLHEVD
jgi:protein-arginine kinase activator protein McsA